MKRQQLESVLFNIAGGFIVLTVVGYIASAELRGKVVPNCAARFAPGQQFLFENAKGQPWTSQNLPDFIIWEESECASMRAGAHHGLGVGGGASS